jgi:hypothetical protein
MKTAKIRFLLALLFLLARGIEAKSDSPPPTPHQYPAPGEVNAERFAELVAWVLDQKDQKHQKTLDASFLENLGLGNKPLTFKRFVDLSKEKRVRTFNVCPETRDIFLSDGKNANDPKSLVIAWIVDKSGNIIRTIESPDPKTYKVVNNAVYQELFIENKQFWDWYQKNIAIIPTIGGLPRLLTNPLGRFACTKRMKI